MNKLTQQEKNECNQDYDLRDMRASYVSETDELSECCGAPILMTTFCKECMEHCK